VRAVAAFAKATIAIRMPRMTLFQSATGIAKARTNGEIINQSGRLTGEPALARTERRDAEKT